MGVHLEGPLGLALPFRRDLCLMHEGVIPVEECDFKTHAALDMVVVKRDTSSIEPEFPLLCRLPIVGKGVPQSGSQVYFVPFDLCY